MANISTNILANILTNIVANISTNIVANILTNIVAIIMTNIFTNVSKHDHILLVSDSISKNAVDKRLRKKEEKPISLQT